MDGAFDGSPLGHLSTTPQIRTHMYTPSQSHLVGTPVGAAVGTPLGLTLGLLLGCFEGTSDGPILGVLSHMHSPHSTKAFHNKDHTWLALHLDCYWALLSGLCPASNNKFVIHITKQSTPTGTRCGPLSGRSRRQSVNNHTASKLRPFAIQRTLMGHGWDLRSDS